MAPRTQNPYKSPLASDAIAASKPGLSLPELISILIACVLIVWRAQAYPISQFWHDWVVIVSGYTIFSALAGRTKAWAPVTVAVMGALLFIFARGNLPKVLSMYEWLP